MSDLRAKRNRRWRLQHTARQRVGGKGLFLLAGEQRVDWRSALAVSGWSKRWQRLGEDGRGCGDDAPDVQLDVAFCDLVGGRRVVNGSS